MNKEVEKAINQAKAAIKNIEVIKRHMKAKGVIGFCSNCGCNLYKDKQHKC